MRYIFTLFLFIIAALAQTVWVNLTKFYSIQPDLVLLVVIYFSLRFSKVSGIAIGFIGGSILDILSFSYYGINVISKVWSGFLVNLIEAKIFKEYIFTQVVVGFSITIFDRFINYLIFAILGLAKQGISDFIFSALSVSLCNAILFPLVCLFFDKIMVRK